ncbi:MAG: nickel-dependent hydrogenase large subunit [Pelobacteraceae bacterium]
MSNLRKLDMLTRVEGHGSVELIRDGERVVDARLNLFESPRLFEALLVGRRFDEIPDIACRICSICSTVHKVAALQGVEQALGISISRQTGLLRELAVQGGQIESHALHIFCLALPDYLGVSGFQELAASVPEKLQMGLRIKKLGNQIQAIVGGRAIHPFNLLVGGLARVPDTGQLRFLSEELAAASTDVAASIAYIFNLNEILPTLALVPSCAVSGGPSLFGDCLVTSVGTSIPVKQSARWLNERIEGHTHAKVSHFDETTPFMVGPLARLLLSMPAEHVHRFTDRSIKSALKARVVELQLAVRRAQELIEYLVTDGLKNEPLSAVGHVQGEGAALVEAPRGVLLHSYRFNDRGICRAANIVTPTAINQGAIAVSLKALIATMDGAGYAQVKRSAEMLVRCYDPCISCAVH